MLDGYIVGKNLLKTTEKITAAMSRDRESREKIAHEEIKARDRVNITLEEYENLKRKNTELENNNRYLKTLLNRIEIPWDKKIIPDSIRVYYNDDDLNFKRTYKILFDIDRLE